MSELMAELIPILYIIFNMLAALFIVIGFKRGIVPNIFAGIFFAVALIWKISFDFLEPIWLDYATVITNAFALFCDGIIIGVKIQGKSDRKFYTEHISHIMNSLYGNDNNIADSIVSENDGKTN